ncbi:MAG: hypothetical protein HN504_01860 [Candidatus Nitrosopelagicus sp.]|jgi:hypothetical protein|nr:hypothetical protein [Candidatus Nitrosopelagicus sp.]MBT6646266.1 hypothetical protein [Nitrososphaerota archaeon]MBT7252938.1 hypothetical protein [Candidatus Nitrosopelagicus sp.]
MRKSDNKLTTCYTSLECNSCKILQKRKFTDGDFVFSSSENCSDCDGKMMITKIFGVTMD